MIGWRKSQNLVKVDVRAAAIIDTRYPRRIAPP